MAQTTFILGAGLGREYGFPDGAELRNLIINELEDHERELKQIVRIGVDLTVDEIAHRYPNHAERLRTIVVKILHNRESEERVVQNEKNTYKLLLRQISAAEAKGDLVNIITFNYDRSLQHLLHLYNSIEPADRKIRAKIVNVHGRLAPLWHEEKAPINRPMPYHDYGGTERPVHRVLTIDFEDDDDQARQVDAAILEQETERALCFASKINFIGNSSKPQDELRALLEASDNIIFLGIGYHRPNMQVLGFDFSQPNTQKVIVGTGLHLEEDDIEYIQRQYPAIQAIVSCTAYTLLKNKLDISDPEKSLYRRKPSSLDPDVLAGYQRLVESMASNTPQLG